jgi:hypothetical protein
MTTSWRGIGPQQTGGTVGARPCLNERRRVRFRNAALSSFRLLTLHRLHVVLTEQSTSSHLDHHHHHGGDDRRRRSHVHQHALKEDP